MKLKRWFAKLGIEISPERRWHVHLKPRFFGIIASIFGLFFLFTLGVAKYSESPSFCNSCHIMSPYYNAWKTSKHNFVACVECHYPPGSPKTLLWKKFQALSQVVKYVTRTYSSKPFAEVEDASCLRSGCHSTRLLQGKVVTQKGIKFDHTAHIMEQRRGRQLRCTSCHSQIVVGRHVEVTYDTCYLCHFKERGEGRDFKPLGGCLGCHDLPTQSFQIGNMTYNHKDFVTKQGVSCQNCHLDVVEGDGAVSEDRCFTCHNQPEKLARFGETTFLHENHVTKHNVACFHCHQEIRHGFKTTGGTKLARLGEPTPEAKLLEEPTRHPTMNFDCGFCHQDKHAGQLEMYSGKVTSLGLPEMPSPMFLAEVDCIGCHYEEMKGEEKEFKGKTFKASEDACMRCHGPSFKGVLEETKRELQKTLEPLKKKMELVQSALDEKTLPPSELQNAEKEMVKVKKWYHFVHASKGAHNIYLASTILRKADEILSKNGEQLRIELPNLSNLPLISGGYCATMCHSKMNVQVPPETVTAFDLLPMPHKFHTTLMSCTQCHEIGAHKKVVLKKEVKEKVCTGCHQF